MRILIIEDESRIATRIERMAMLFFGNKLSAIHRCDALADGLLYLEHHQVDLLLLDLNLNGEDGFDVLENFVSRSFHTIIISAYTHLAIKAFEYGVLDFVPKPFDEQRINQAFLRMATVQNTATTAMSYLSVKKGGSMLLIDIKELCYVKGAGIYTELHLLNGKYELHDKSLEKLQQLLPISFQRIHKSYLVATPCIEKIMVNSGSKYTLLLKTGEVLPIGRSRYKELKSKLI
ncbi:response regulator transcription factor [Pedobacter polaris]|uniref:Response regulator transcription factor n=1 Tax=Pedobacter polaris TaxID=2571273 RepID=A0A4V5P0B0_9SPHI|nr:LytTR family DNA-binding domain-containing protein [Pedobacter polaris]TKC12822.1 response regulator transcription factor [Pedobacter polaris]